MQLLQSGAGVQLGKRPAGYYEQARPEVAALVPSRCRRVLDVGCGTGALGQLLRRRGHHVTGFELSPDAAAEAEHYLDDVHVGDVEMGLPFEPASFDAIVLADLLEHLVNPWRVLSDCVSVLAPKGVVVASVPNVQNIDVLKRLLRGRWDYRERGILDRGHLRFFTLATIRSLFEDVGLKIVHIGHRYRRSALRESICWLTAGRARAFFTRQYLIVAQMSTIKDEG